MISATRSMSTSLAFDFPSNTISITASFSMLSTSLLKDVTKTCDFSARCFRILKKAPTLSAPKEWSSSSRR